MTNQPGKTHLWKHISEIRKETLQYILDRKDGKIKSIKTPWANLNEALLDGLEWGGLYIIAARPGVGKTAISDQIARELKLHNPGLDMAVLKFQFEMTDRMTGGRELTSVLDVSIKQLFNADPNRPILEDDIERISRYYAQQHNDDIYQISKSRTPAEFRNDVLEFHKYVKKPFMVMLDHSILTKRAADEQTQLETLYNLSAAIVDLKRRIPDSIYIILSQMNRNIEDPARREPGKIGNYPNSGDIFGADALMQNCDATIALTRPDLLGINRYGQEKYVVTPGLIVAHLLKNRFGTQDIMFFKEDLKYYQIEAAPVPQRVK